MTPMRTLLVCLAAALALTACAKSVSQQTAYMNGLELRQQAGAPSRYPPPAYKTYPVSAAFGPHAVKLTVKQRAWLVRILHSRTYGPKRAELRFADMPGFTTPLVVYVNYSNNGAPIRGAHVIGESCNSEFDPQEHGLFPGTEASCEGPTPLPVIP